jgi:hypothetical protein
MGKKTPHSINRWVVTLIKFFLREFFFGIKISQGSCSVVVFIDDSQRLVLIAAPAMISGTKGIIGFELNIVLKDIAHFISVFEKRENDIAYPVFDAQTRENISFMIDMDIVSTR